MSLNLSRLRARYVHLEETRGRVVTPALRVLQWPARSFGFSWVTPLITTGAARPLDHCDMLRLPRGEDTPSVSDAFARLWASGAGEGGGSSLWRLVVAMHRQVGWQYYWAGVLKLSSSVVMFATPQLLAALVSFIETGHAAGRPLWEGYAYAAGISLCSVAGAVLDVQYDYTIDRVSTQARTALETGVFRKTLSRWSGRAGTEGPEADGGGGSDQGTVINLVSVDVQRITNFCASFHAFWSLPLQITVALVLLYGQVGAGVFAGLALAALLVPVNMVIANRIALASGVMMKDKDLRVRRATELFTGIRVVKFNVWERVFVERVQEARTRELASLRYRKYLDALCVFFWATTPVLVSLVTFATYAGVMHGDLTAARVFTSMSLFNLMITPLNAFPWVLNGLLEARVSLRRVAEYLCERDAPGPGGRLPWGQGEGVDGDVEVSEDGSAVAVDIDGDSFTWTTPPETPNGKPPARAGQAAAAEPLLPRQGSPIGDVEEGGVHTGAFVLDEIRLRVGKGTLTVVVGPVGSGKSSLLAAILGEMTVLRGGGGPRVGGRLAYASQQAWVQNGTIRDNICFTLPYDPRRYARVVEACALASDLDGFAAGDLTEIGERGVNLSGGQKQRIALARAAYQDRDVYLLDDPLSACDAAVARSIFLDCICGGVMAGRTRIVATHAEGFVGRADQVVVMKGGRIAYAGPPRQAEVQRVLGAPLGAAKSDPGDPDAQEEQVSCDDTDDESGGRREERGRLVSKERSRVGAVRCRVLGGYLWSAGPIVVVMLLLWMVLMQLTRNLSDWWLSHWVDGGSHTAAWPVSALVWLLERAGMDHSDHPARFYITGLASIALANSIATLFRSFLFAYAGLAAATRLHNQQLQAVVRAPVRFFDTNPTGRIVNRFSRDQYAVDEQLPFVSNILLACLFALCGTLLVLGFSTTLPFLALVALLSALYYAIQRHYRAASRELRRLDSVSRSAVYAYFLEAYQGAWIIRSMDGAPAFVSNMIARLDRNQRACFSGMAASAWLKLRLQMLGATVTMFVAFSGIVQVHMGARDPGRGAGLVGLGLSYSLSIVWSLSGLISSFTDTEKELISVERIVDYIDGVGREEALAPGAAAAVGPEWPRAGAIVFEDVCMRYQANQRRVMDGLSLAIRGGERIGIAGRTGAGKSSILNVLYRFVAVESGRVTIDGVPIEAVGLARLRGSMSVIPQDPILFEGTVRFNLDPEGRHSDAELWEALDQAHIGPKIRSFQDGLSYAVTGAGANFSVGERQLLCLARALVRRSRIVCIDEATASVDGVTDGHIQDTIKSAFSGSTRLIIAHRVASILDSDRVLVLGEGGAILEFDTPEALLARPGGALSDLVRSSLLQQ